MKCPGLHCDGCSGDGGTGMGGGVGGLALAVVGILAALAVVARVVSDVLAWLAEVWPWLVAGGCLALAGAGWLLVALARRQRAEVTWQLGRPALARTEPRGLPAREPRRLPAPEPRNVVPGLVIRPPEAAPIGKGRKGLPPGRGYR